MQVYIIYTNTNLSLSLVHMNINRHKYKYILFLDVYFCRLDTCSTQYISFSQ